MMNLRKITCALVLLGVGFSTVVHATPTDEIEKSVLNAMKTKVVKTQVLTDDFDSQCKKNRQFFFSTTPDMVLEFRCNRVNVYWEKYKDAGFEKKNQQAVEQARKAVVILGEQQGKEFDQVIAGTVFKGTLLPNGRKLNGSCASGSSCILTYRLN